MPIFSLISMVTAMDNNTVSTQTPFKATPPVERDMTCKKTSVRKTYYTSAMEKEIYLQSKANLKRKGSMSREEIEQLARKAVEEWRYNQYVLPF